MSKQDRPILTVIAGPNGSGKSTLTASIVGATHVPTIDPDAIARALNVDAPEAVAVAAGREALRRQHTLLKRGISFAVETTLAGNTPLRLMNEARTRGFIIHLIFVCLASPEINVLRVMERVASGGHSVPSNDVRRRYARSLANLPDAMALAEHTTIFDNSAEHEPYVVLAVDAGRITYRAPDLPAWLTGALGAFLAERP